MVCWMNRWNILTMVARARQKMVKNRRKTSPLVRSYPREGFVNHIALNTFGTKVYHLSAFGDTMSPMPQGHLPGKVTKDSPSLRVTSFSSSLPCPQALQQDSHILVSSSDCVSEFWTSLAAYMATPSEVLKAP